MLMKRLRKLCVMMTGGTMTENLIDGLMKLDKMFDYILEKTNNSELTGVIVRKLGLDDPHISRSYTLEEYKLLADKMIKLMELEPKITELNQ